MRKILMFFAAAVMIGTASCGGNADKKNPAVRQPQAVAAPAGETVVGEWDIVEIVCGDSVRIVPADLLPDAAVTMTFRADDTFYAATGCNQISGGYASRGNTIKFADAMMTEMACEHMEIEDALRVLLPRLEYCQFPEGGSEAELKTADGNGYIKLSRIVATPGGEEL